MLTAVWGSALRRDTTSHLDFTKSFRKSDFRSEGWSRLLYLGTSTWLLGGYQDASLPEGLQLCLVVYLLGQRSE
jgi:hypothetical protein